MIICTHLSGLGFVTLFIILGLELGSYLKLNDFQKYIVIERHTLASAFALRRVDYWFTDLPGSVSMEFTCFHYMCVGFQSEILFPPTEQNQADQGLEPMAGNLMTAVIGDQC